MGGEKPRQKSLRIGVHHANAVVWGPVYRTRLDPSHVPHRLLAPRVELLEREPDVVRPLLPELRAVVLRERAERGGDVHERGVGVGRAEERLEDGDRGHLERVDPAADAALPVRDAALQALLAEEVERRFQFRCGSRERREEEEKRARGGAGGTTGESTDGDGDGVGSKHCAGERFHPIDRGTD